MEELEQRVGASEAKSAQWVADMEQSITASENIELVTALTMDALKAKWAGWQACAKASEDSVCEATGELKTKLAALEAKCNQSMQREKETEARSSKFETIACAWSKFADYLSSKQLEDALGCTLEQCLQHVKTPMEKMTNLAILACISFRPTDTYSAIRKKLLLATHPDKRSCPQEEEVLYDKICKALFDLPTHDE